MQMVLSKEPFASLGCQCLLTRLELPSQGKMRKLFHCEMNTWLEYHQSWHIKLGYGARERITEVNVNIEGSSGAFKKEENRIYAQHIRILPIS